MNRNVTTVDEYLATLPADRREALEAVRSVIRENLDADYEEGMQYGMIGYYVPHRVYPPGYHCNPKEPLPFAGLASQKNHMGLYLMSLYGHPQNEAWFRRAWGATGKKLDMGKACIRFRKLDDLPLDVIGQAIARVPAQKYIEHYEANRPPSAKRAETKGAGKRAGGKSPAQTAPKKPAAQKTVAGKRVARATKR